MTQNTVATVAEDKNDPPVGYLVGSAQDADERPEIGIDHVTVVPSNYPVDE